jgi:RNA polymerase sigma-54 factor
MTISKPSMKMGLSVRTGMAQQTLMTPQLQQAIKLLTMTKFELGQYLDSEVENNPFLEIDDKASQESDFTGETKYLLEKFQDLALPKQRENLGEQASYDESFYATDSIANQKISLHEFVEEQISLMRLAEFETEMVLQVLNFMNDDGFFEADKETLLSETLMHPDDLNFAITCIQNCEPYGIGTFSVQESLLLQLAQKKNAPKYTEEIILNHWNLLQKNDLEKIQKFFLKNKEITKNNENAVLNIKAAVWAAVSFISSNLDPKPARQFGNSIVGHITPDVYAFKKDGKWVVSLNEDGLPRLKISEKFLQESERILNELKASTEPKEKKQFHKNFLNEKLSAAKWVQRALTERNKSLLRVTELIVDWQQDFLELGLEYLKPVNLKFIAEKLGLSESTVSRCTSGKHLFVNGGLLDLKEFFNTGLSSQSGDEVANETIKVWVRDLIQKENPECPLSDQEISETIFSLKKMKVARRTVSKYRESLGILSSTHRKRANKNKGA